MNRSWLPITLVVSVAVGIVLFDVTCRPPPLPAAVSPTATIVVTVLPAPAASPTLIPVPTLEPTEALPRVTSTSLPTSTSTPTVAPTETSTPKPLEEMQQKG